MFLSGGWCDEHVEVAHVVVLQIEVSFHAHVADVLPFCGKRAD